MNDATPHPALTLQLTTPATTQPGTQPSPSDDIEFTLAWINETMHADFWWRIKGITAVQAAMLLSGYNPNTASPGEAKHSANEEMGPENFRALKNLFKSEGKGTLLPLQTWKKSAEALGLKIHSWVNTWEKRLAEIEARIDTDGDASACAPVNDCRATESINEDDNAVSLFDDASNLAEDDDWHHDDDYGIALPPDIPGKIPLKNNGRLAIKAAWQIECHTGRGASASEVMALLQEWADSGAVPGILIRSVKEQRAVIWLTTTHIQKTWGLDALQTTLKKWRRSRIAVAFPMQED